MIRKLAYGALAFLWAGFVFVVTLWLTFPEQAVKEWLIYKADQMSQGRTALQLESVSPWWIGLKVTGVRLFDRDPRNPDAPPTLKMAADTATASVNPFGLARGRPYVKGHLDVGDTRLDYGVGVLIDKERSKGWSVTAVHVDGADANLGDLIQLSPYPMTGTGSVDIAVDITAETGMRDGAGTASISGKNLLLSDLGLESLAAFGAPTEVPIDDMELTLLVKDGRATIQRGTIASSLGTVTLDGDVTLKDDLPRSHVKADAVVQLGADYAKFGSMAGEAMWSDGKLHFTCTGYLVPPTCRADRESRVSRGGRTSVTPGTVGAPPLGDEDMTAPPAGDDEAARRREEVKDRLRKRREEREARRGATAIPAGGDEPIGASDKGIGDEEPLPIPEEDPLPPDEEEPPPLEEEQ